MLAVPRRRNPTLEKQAPWTTTPTQYNIRRFVEDFEILGSKLLCKLKKKKKKSCCYKSPGLSDACWQGLTQLLLTF